MKKPFFALKNQNVQKMIARARECAEYDRDFRRERAYDQAVWPGRERFRGRAPAVEIRTREMEP